MEYRHFSHNHRLIPLHLDPSEKISCFGCERGVSVSDTFRGCLQCSYYLHDACLHAPRSLRHPSHPPHPLTLLPSPTYPGAAFCCSACAADGSSFCFGCAECEFDLHLGCARLPLTAVHPAHPHELKLVLELPNSHDDPPSIFGCDACGAVMSGQCWAYYCAECDFGAHVGCVDDSVARPETPQGAGGGASDQAAKRDRNRGGSDANPTREAMDEMMASQIMEMQSNSRRVVLDLV